MAGLELLHSHHLQVYGIEIINNFIFGSNRNRDSCWYTRLCHSYDQRWVFIRTQTMITGCYRHGGDIVAMFRVFCF